ncbi:MAG: hypothetical protein ACFFD1_05680 [Candidatus Thorarchaeota archaeon]
MCLLCHINLSDIEIFEQINSSTLEEFKLWNSTSLNHMLIASSGYNGDEVRNIAIRVLSEYFDWLQKTYQISKKMLLNILIYIKSHPIHDKNKEQLNEYLQSLESLLDRSKLNPVFKNAAYHFAIKIRNDINADTSSTQRRDDLFTKLKGFLDMFN